MAKVARQRRPRRSTASAAPSQTLTLPTQDNKPPTTLNEVVCCIYGRKGIGKTSLASQFPNSLTFMFERGRRNLAIRQVPQEKGEELDWNSFKSYVELFINSDEYETAVIDTVDRCYDKCLEYVCQENGCTHPNQKNDYGDTWSQVKREFDALLGMIHDSGKGLILLSHETLKPLNKGSKGLVRADAEKAYEFERLEPSCTGQAFGVIQEICDYVFYYGFVDEFRCLTLRSPNDVCWTSCGLSDTFLNPDGTPIRTFRVGNSSDDAYNNLVAAFNNESEDLDYKPPRK